MEKRKRWTKSRGVLQCAKGRHPISCLAWIRRSGNSCWKRLASLTETAPQGIETLQRPQRRLFAIGHRPVLGDRPLALTGGLMPEAEQHFVHRVAWLRAAVLGANDGVISTASLVVGVTAAAAGRGEILTAAFAGWAAGAMSMAAGEYVSVSSQADSEFRRP